MPAGEIDLFSRSAFSAESSLARIMWARPRIAFIGVRISWLILARKALFAWLAFSASCVASTSCAVRSATKILKMMPVLIEFFTETLFL